MKDKKFFFQIKVNTEVSALQEISNEVVQG